MIGKAQHRAHMAVLRALKRGTLVKPDACQSCGTEDERLEGHHYDGYEDERRLAVLFVCRSCHLVGHAQERARLARERLLAVITSRLVPV